MKILYFGSLCDEEWFESISNTTGLPSRVAQYSFEKALVNGVSDIKDIDMEIYYLYQEQYYPKGKFLKFKKRKKQLNNKNMVRYLSNINLPLIKEIYSVVQGIYLTLKWGLKNFKSKEKVILTPFNYTPLSFGIYIASKLLGIKRVNIFTDLSSDIINANRQKEMHWIKRNCLSYYMKLVNYIEHNYDGYILFAEPMNKKVNLSDRPYIVMEGIFNNDLDLSPVTRSKAIMYAGTLAFEYGVKNILDAFERIEDNELELWLFGDGDMREYIENLSIKDKRIKYFGFRSRAEVFEYEKRAKLLINARNPADEYTMYSFPSKTFEYMVSGTPFLTTRLKGIPQEYDKYIYSINDSDINSIKQEIEKILSIPDEEINKFTQDARLFILENKNSAVQAKKVLDFLDVIID
ncbi:glycosyltransferase [Bacillus mycoides]|uniref:glycosyltransferase n=1 Tax=Bacillus mycoides TaxID=1405 RepID=UPI0011F09209|nr:glycosyltransferase [Bacillus mycoides]QEL87782.1 glycosyltransferase [Bacillus mycoides]